MFSGPDSQFPIGLEADMFPQRSFRTASSLALSVIGFLGIPGSSRAAPDPGLSNVPECIPVTPNGALSFRVTIVGTTGPIDQSVVEVRFTAVGDTLVCWCSSNSGPRPRSFFGTTNILGIANIFISGGGCIEKGLSGIPGPDDYAAEVFADGIKMQECGVVSPDAVDATGRLVTDGHGADGTGYCSVGLSDAVRYTDRIGQNIYDWCSDLNCDGAVGIADGVIFTDYAAFATFCSGRSGP
jgi:hypothetical protein